MGTIALKKQNKYLQRKSTTKGRKVTFSGKKTKRQKKMGKKEKKFKTQKNISTKTVEKRVETNKRKKSKWEPRENLEKLKEKIKKKSIRKRRNKYDSKPTNQEGKIPQRQLPPFSGPPGPPRIPGKPPPPPRKPLPGSPKYLNNLSHKRSCCCCCSCCNQPPKRQVPVKPKPPPPPPLVPKTSSIEVDYIKRVECPPKLPLIARPCKYAKPSAGANVFPFMQPLCLVPIGMSAPIGTPSPTSSPRTSLRHQSKPLDKPSLQHDPLRSLQNRPIRSPQHVPIRSPQHDPIRSPQHVPIRSPQHDPIIVSHVLFEDDFSPKKLQPRPKSYCGSVEHVTPIHLSQKKLLSHSCSTQKNNFECELKVINEVEISTKEQSLTD